MKKLIMCSVFAVFCGALLFAQNYRDGFYFAQENDFTNNYKDQVVIEVKGGNIASVNWNRETLAAGLVNGVPTGMPDFKTLARSNASAKTWADQAKVAEDYLVSSKNVNATSVPNFPSGTANATIFFDLVKKALASQPVAKGTYKDGWYYGIGVTDKDYGTDYVVITIVNGTIVDVLWNGVYGNGSKMVLSRSGGYDMSIAGAKNPWHVQSANVGKELVRVQNPDLIKVTNNKPDAISGASIAINYFLAAAKLALQSAR